MTTGFVVLYQDEIVGFASVEIYSKKLSEIQCLAVSQQHQGKGLGGFLVANCVELARERGVMEVMAISSSDGFLLNQGFNYSLPNQKKALFIQLRSREEVYRELEESAEE
jgi:amino-acid N-acetyltransferase